jgi:ABC-type transport system substrate-binding protein
MAPPKTGFSGAALGESTDRKRLVFKVVPEPTTRAAMLKRGEVDVAYMLDAPQALELQRIPR